MAASRKAKLDIKNGYSLGQAIAGRIGIRTAYQNDQQNPTMLEAIGKLDYLAQQYAQNLGIDPQRMLNFLNGIDSKSSDGNLFTSTAQVIIEKELASDGLNSKVGIAYDLGWKTSTYSQTCALALSRNDRDPSFAATFMGAYPEMVRQLAADAKQLGYRTSVPDRSLSIADTCKDLSATVSTLNSYLKNR
jgi:hypothetical protein